MKSIPPEPHRRGVNGPGEKNKECDSLMNKDDWLSVCQGMVHRQDRDRLMCAMVAPLDKRRELLALLAFNLEIATIPELVSEAMLGEIRLQWWRQTLDALYGGNRVDHPVALGLAGAIENSGLSKSLFDSYLDARAFDLTGAAPTSLQALESYADGTAGALHELMAEVLGLAALAQEQQGRVRTAIRHGGIAWALTGLLAARAFHLRQGRSYLPVDQEDAEAAVAEAARRHINEARSARKDVPKSLLPIMLPVALAEYSLRHAHAGGARRLFGFYLKVVTGRY